MAFWEALTYFERRKSKSIVNLKRVLLILKRRDRASNDFVRDKMSEDLVIFEMKEENEIPAN